MYGGGAKCMPASTVGIKISAKADAQWSANQKCQIDQIHGRLTTKSAGRPSPMAGGNKTVAGGLKPWPVRCGDGQQAIPCPHKQNTSVWSTTKHKTNKSRGLEARRATEISENLRRTRIWMITECSKGDVQVLRTVKNGVSTVTPL